MASTRDDSEAKVRVARTLRRAAPVLLIATFLALFLAPLALGARVVAASTQLNDVDDPARLALDLIALTTASQSSAIRAFAVLPDDESREPFARAYQEAYEAQTRAFDSIRPLLPKLGEKPRAEILALERSLESWRALHDDLLDGRITREMYAAGLEAQQDRLAQAVAHSRAALKALNDESAALRRDLSRVTRVQTTTTAALGALALLSILVTLWLARRSELVDATRREKRLAEELAVARADVLSWVSHDLKNPLAAIRMGCTNLRRALEKNPARAPFIVDTIDRSALRMSRLIRDLLDSARLDAGRGLVMDVRPVDLEQLMAGTCEEAEQLANGEVRITCIVDEPLPPVRADPLRVEQALLNLLQNATRANGGQGTVEVRARREGESVKVAVKDHGPGIPDDVLPRLFTPFRAAQRSESTGLGLSIVKAVVEAHGGRVSLDTEKDRGTTFYFTLPAERPEGNGESARA